MLLLVPNGSVPVQWQSFLYQHCPALKLIVSSDSRPTSAVCKDMWVSSTAMRTAPDNLEEWPENLQYIWDKNDPLASTTVLLVPYTTFAVRSMRVRWHQSGEYEAGAVWSGKHQCHMRPEYRQRYKKRFSVVVCDEGHRLRHPKTLIHKAVKMLKAEINWVLSETYQINSADDIVVSWLYFGLRQTRECVLSKKISTRTFSASTTSRRSHGSFSKRSNPFQGTTPCACCPCARGASNLSSAVETQQKCRATSAMSRS
ncbi:hypothetical protein IWZ00DRAFT_292032 [Phyllosticta capitalensis]